MSCEEIEKTPNHFEALILQRKVLIHLGLHLSCKVHPAFIKLLDEHDGVGLDLVLVHDGGGSGDGERLIVIA